MNTSLKHTITCRCILSQHKTSDNAPLYSFIVFSEIDKVGNFIEKLVECTNCGIVHRVYEACQSEITTLESTNIVNIDDVSLLLPPKIVHILKDYSCELPVYEEAKFIFENELWGSFIILTRDYINNEYEHYAEGKKLVINSALSYDIGYWKTQT